MGMISIDNLLKLKRGVGFDDEPEFESIFDTTAVLYRATCNSVTRNADSRASCECITNQIGKLLLRVSDSKLGGMLCRSQFHKSVMVRKIDTVIIRFGAFTLV